MAVSGRDQDHPNDEITTGRPRGGDALEALTKPGRPHSFPSFSRGFVRASYLHSPEEHPCSVPCLGRRLSAHSDPPQVQARPPRRSRRRATRRCLPLEQLEGRLVLSAFHVTTLTDGGAGSLRDAITQANTHAGADIIVFQPGLTGTIALTGGELDITDDLTINGPGADKLTVSGNNISRVFKVESGETVRISGLTIAGGNAGTGNGGGIDNFGTLTVSDSVFSGNSATNGGGLANESGGTATVSGSTFTGNSARRRSTATAAASPTAVTATVSGSTFTGNSAIDGGGLANDVAGRRR